MAAGSGVVDAGERQTLRWGDGADRLAVPGIADVAHRIGTVPALADRNQAADDRADHLVAEGRSSNFKEHQTAVPAAGVKTFDVAHQVFVTGPAAEGAEVVLTDQMAPTGVHRLHVE